MTAYMYNFSLLYENSDACFPKFGAALTPYLMYNVYTNYSKHRLKFHGTAIAEIIYDFAGYEYGKSTSQHARHGAKII